MMCCKLVPGCDSGPGRASGQGMQASARKLGWPRAHWPAGLDETIKEVWHAEHGDRRTSLVCIGQELDHAAATKALDACLHLYDLQLDPPMLQARELPPGMRERRRVGHRLARGQRRQGFGYL